MLIQVEACECDICGHRWLASQGRPKRCAKCKGSRWNVNETSQYEIDELPSVVLTERSNLPSAPGLYFVFSSGALQYVGMARQLNLRWAHHERRKSLDKLPNVRISYLGLRGIDAETLEELECALISILQPPLNGTLPKPLGGRVRMGFSLAPDVMRILNENSRSNLHPEWPTRTEIIEEAVRVWDTLRERNLLENVLSIGPLSRTHEPTDAGEQARAGLAAVKGAMPDFPTEQQAVADRAGQKKPLPTQLGYQPCPACYGNGVPGCSRCDGQGIIPIPIERKSKRASRQDAEESNSQADRAERKEPTLAELQEQRRVDKADRKKAKELKIWNGRGWGTRGTSSYVAHCYVAAYSRADAVRLINEVDRRAMMTDREIKAYFAECWGSSMDGITPERGVWVQRTGHSQEKPERIFPKAELAESVKAAVNPDRIIAVGATVVPEVGVSYQVRSCPHPAGKRTAGKEWRCTACGFQHKATA